MQMEPQGCPNCEPQPCFNSILINQESIPEKDVVCNVITESQSHDIPKPVKKKTRQWAAWTRQEEERYFTALRQVGKNFEKITSRVQTKNKDQVRHYYYRLVRRMNKLLGPGVCLDAKNSKDTNAAMLRWWSLLEKFSWKVSKLHLKPRKFKIFVETLEHQLLKDQRKGRKRKQPEQESPPPAILPLASNQTGVLGQDNAAGKVILDNTQNITKQGVKGSSTRRNANTKNNGSNRKVEFPPVKKTSQRKKPSTASTSSYKKWEKAAMAGVSLVADAAEHLERETVDKENTCVNASLGQHACDTSRKDSTPPQVNSPRIFDFNNVQSPAKLKLQLFPVDEATRKALEMDNHNPHLELTLGIRKKISSVLEHLNRKWGNCSLASGELVLFPYNILIENSNAHQRWTQDSVLCAGDIHGLIGSPQFFRLRYGWFCKNKLPQVPLIPSCTNGVFGSSSINNCNDHLESSNQMRNKSLLIETSNQEIAREKVNKDDRRLRTGASLSVGEWADSLTNISVGDLLTGVPEDINSNYVDQPQSRYFQSLEPQLPFNSDSFDAAIAAHVQRYNQKQTSLGPAPSIWDAEETCDAFSFRKNSVQPEELHSISNMLVEDLANKGESANGGNIIDDCPFDSPIVENSPKDLNGLTDIYWTDSLGPLGMDFCSAEDVLLSSSLNRLLANSLDAFQYCSISMDKKEKMASTEVQKQKENAANKNTS
ncbi:TSL-kinase interacting protein 1-like [Impatiens glandulifera]|uniref:TSL-kinase interacting protein 1-like n=1 Tax=Impatiens glandulifera TaxID=253017 RepID=UPI001FB0B5D6|nr:TSL-kinase interacting protein 1-like [Impatiens glandulifera]XP_047335013.1 TSL-kinase interacting protein 1-like [Impatiens glandulifera]XP_047335014.1 TSL-kinase interacting protein 1-like [Impatiens glandulifera]